MEFVISASIIQKNKQGQTFPAITNSAIFHVVENSGVSYGCLSVTKDQSMTPKLKTSALVLYNPVSKSSGAISSYFN